MLSDGTQMPYDLFLGVPRHKVPSVVEASALAVDGWVPVDPRTLETAYPDVYALGDVTSVGTPKAGVFSEASSSSPPRSSPGCAEHPAPLPTTGADLCHLEFGHNLVGRVTVTFPPGGPPFGDLEGPSPLLAADKADFAASRIHRWFNQPPGQGRSARPGQFVSSDGSQAIPGRIFHGTFNN